MSDKRSVATDALATLGTIIDGKQKRDAIHIAVEPVIAGSRLSPGAHVVVSDGVAWETSTGDGTGIVDPFLTNLVEKGQRFWFLMYPRMVTSLRHVWSHPAFPDEAGVTAQAPALAVDKAASERWLRDFCERSNCPSYEAVIAAIVEGDGDGEYLHFDGRDAHGEIPPEFWTHVEIVLGRKLEHHPDFFSCSC